MKQFRLTHPFLSAGGALLLAVIAFASGISAVSLLNKASTPTESAAAAAIVFPAPLLVDPSQLIGQAAVVYDPATGTILYSKNSKPRFHLHHSPNS